jgi:hypothetical protein
MVQLGNIHVGLVASSEVARCGSLSQPHKHNVNQYTAHASREDSTFGEGLGSERPSLGFLLQYSRDARARKAALFVQYVEQNAGKFVQHIGQNNGRFAPLTSSFRVKAWACGPVGFSLRYTGSTV